MIFRNVEQGEASGCGAPRPPHGRIHGKRYVRLHALRCLVAVYMYSACKYMQLYVRVQAIPLISLHFTSPHLTSPLLYNPLSHQTHTGNKVFRYQSWEAQQLHAQLQSAQLSESVPVAGLYSYGAFTRLQDSAIGRSGSLCALMYGRVTCRTYDIVFLSISFYDILSQFTILLVH
jgi:hypothetical protein